MCRQGGDTYGEWERVKIRMMEKEWEDKQKWMHNVNSKEIDSHKEDLTGFCSVNPNNCGTIGFFPLQTPCPSLLLWWLVWLQSLALLGFLLTSFLQSLSLSLYTNIHTPNFAQESIERSFSTAWYDNLNQ